MAISYQFNQCKVCKAQLVVSYFNEINSIMAHVEIFTFTFNNDSKTAWFRRQFWPKSNDLTWKLTLARLEVKKPRYSLSISNSSSMMSPTRPWAEHSKNTQFQSTNSPNGNSRVSGGGQVDRDRTGRESSRRTWGKWASAGTRLKRLQRTGRAGGIVSPSVSLTPAEPGTRNIVSTCYFNLTTNTL